MTADFTRHRCIYRLRSSLSKRAFSRNLSLKAWAIPPSVGRSLLSRDCDLAVFDSAPLLRRPPSEGRHRY
jgi:hypothetical protein